MTSPRASLVLLNYNGWEMLDAALPSALGQVFDGYEVVVVDNGSSDASVSRLRESWPQVRVVALPRNLGVTAALNAMTQAAQGDYVALLNNDVELSPDWLAVLVEALEREPRAAAAAGKLLRMSARDVIDRAGDELRWSSACHGRGAGERDVGQYDVPGEVFSVGGAAAVYRRAAFEQVGPFDDAFFAYLEDVDWGFRARLAGYVALYEPAAVGFHRGGATLGEVNEFSLYHLRRNQVWLVVKNFPAASLVRHAPAILLFNAVQLALSIRRGNLALVARAYRDALAGLPAMLRKRRAIQSRRKIAPAQLESLIAPSSRPW